MKTALVVPTIREHNINKFLESWKETNFDYIIIIEDNPTKTFKLNIEHHYSWSEIKEDLKENSFIISKRDSACRSYGFLIAYRLNTDVIFTLDDDCLPYDADFVNGHLNQLFNIPKWDSLLDIRTRGMPYRNIGKLDNVVLNMGLWTDIPDQDAINQLSNPITNYIPNITSRVLAKGQYAPICGMNLAFKKEILPALYFPLMGENQPFSRFDDIWCNVITKKICDHLNLLISYGKPFIHHIRASNPFNNLIKEANGIKFNETFWEIIDNINLSSCTVNSCMQEISDVLEKEKDNYLQLLGLAMKVWSKQFNME